MTLKLRAIFKSIMVMENNFLHNLLKPIVTKYFYYKLVATMSCSPSYNTIIIYNEIVLKQCWGPFSAGTKFEAVWFSILSNGSIQIKGVFSKYVRQAVPSGLEPGCVDEDINDFADTLEINPVLIKFYGSKFRVVEEHPGNWVIHLDLTDLLPLKLTLLQEPPTIKDNYIPKIIV